jgi:uracil-DNA glycosylase
MTEASPCAPLPPFAATSGPRDAKMLIVGEAFGQSEAELRKPFVGESGKELHLMLGEAMPEVEPELHARASAMHRYGLAWVRPREEWLAAAGIAMTNVLALRPPGNKIEELCVAKADLPDKGKGYEYPAVANGKYLRPEFFGEISRLHTEIGVVNPNLVLALGNTACWAVLRATNIGQTRGAITQTFGGYGDQLTPERPFRKIKTLASYHPAGVMRQWAWRPIVVADLMKAWREAQFPDIKRPRREVLVNPTIEEVEAWVAQTLANPPAKLSPDIETGGGQIRMIGFARSRSEAIVIPFTDPAKASGSYWETSALEERAWLAVEKLLGSPIEKLFQNGMYDLQYLTKLGLKVDAARHDCMLLHHSMFPEMQKGLGFLGSIYSSEPAWKLMRSHRADTEKADE